MNDIELDAEYNDEAEDFEEDSVYSEDCREEMLDDDELDPIEAAFMRGWDKAG